MDTQRCPLCGSQSLEMREGEYHFEPPENMPGGTVIVPNVAWRTCTACGESLLPRSITKALEMEQRRRLEVAVPVAH